MRLIQSKLRIILGLLLAFGFLAGTPLLALTYCSTTTQVVGQADKCSLAKVKVTVPAGCSYDIYSDDLFVVVYVTDPKTGVTSETMGACTHTNPGLTHCM